MHIADKTENEIKSEEERLLNEKADKVSCISFNSVFNGIHDAAKCYGCQKNQNKQQVHEIVPGSVKDSKIKRHDKKAKVEFVEKKCGNCFKKRQNKSKEAGECCYYSQTWKEKI